MYKTESKSKTALGLHWLVSYNDTNVQDVKQYSRAGKEAISLLVFQCAGEGFRPICGCPSQSPAGSESSSNSPKAVLVITTPEDAHELLEAGNAARGGDAFSPNQPKRGGLEGQTRDEEHRKETARL